MCGGIIKLQVPPCTPISTPAHPVSPLTLSSMCHSPETFWRSKNEESGPRSNIQIDSALQHLILSFKFLHGPRQPEFQYLLLSRDPAACFQLSSLSGAQESSSLSPKYLTLSYIQAWELRTLDPKHPTPRPPTPTCLGS